jgi:hypothetical protein
VPIKSVATAIRGCGVWIVELRERGLGRGEGISLHKGRRYLSVSADLMVTMRLFASTRKVASELEAIAA